MPVADIAQVLVTANGKGTHQSKSNYYLTALAHPSLGGLQFYLDGWQARKSVLNLFYQNKLFVDGYQNGGYSVDHCDYCHKMRSCIYWFSNGIDMEQFSPMCSECVNTTNRALGALRSKTSEGFQTQKRAWQILSKFFSRLAAKRHYKKVVQARREFLESVVLARNHLIYGLGNSGIPRNVAFVIASLAIKT